ncbi:MAG: serine/threonine protein kinase [Deltaproteobacteria bacterium]|nr:MAG: serine/threonine protein kinase [Deltaproteobacteria bacterium]
MMPGPMQLTSGMLIRPHLRLVRVLGMGGMGSVWLAEHLALELQVAVKVLHQEALDFGGANVLSRFRREARAAAKINSPHVARVFDLGAMADGTPFIVMELIKGETLTRYAGRRGRLRPEDVAPLLSQVVKALTDAHRCGVVHRDIKPDNIMLMPSTNVPFVKVLDFGLAKPMSEWQDGVSTATGARMGTAAYMSPEQVMDSKGVDHRTDLWSLGVVAYELLTERLPFGMDGSALLAMHQRDFVPPSQRVEHLPTGVDSWFRHALHPRRNRRFQSAVAMARAFRRTVKAARAAREGQGAKIAAGHLALTEAARAAKAADRAWRKAALARAAAAGQLQTPAFENARRHSRLQLPFVLEHR